MSKELKKYQGGGYAAPLGQAPLGVIRPPDTRVSVPNPLDVTNFYRMQQGVQNNLGLVQNQQRIIQNQQQLDLQNYELLLKESDQILGMIGGAWDSTYAQHQSNKQSAASGIGGMFGYLDPTKTEHAKIINKYSDEYEALTAQLTKLGQGYLSSSTRDPAQRLEIAHQIAVAKNDFYRKLMTDEEFVKQNQAAMAYDGYMQDIQALKDRGYSVDADEFDRVTKLYDDYVNGRGTTSVDANGNTIIIPPKAPKFTDYDPNRAVYDPKAAFKGISEAAAALAPGQETTGWEILPDGQRVEKKFRTPLTSDQLTNLLVERYKNDPNVIKLYNNTADKTKISFQDWIKQQVAPYAIVDPNAGQEVVTDYGSTVVKPYESSAQKAAAKRPGTNSDGNWFDVSTDTGRAAQDTAESIYDYGYQVNNADKFAIRAISKDPERFGLEEGEDENGDPVLRAYMYEVDDKGHRVIGGSKEVYYTFSPRPTDTSQFESTNSASEGDDLGSRNNNPFNIRPVGRGKEATGEKGFKKFNSIEEGFEAGKSDIMNKIAGNSDAVRNSEYMKSKYTPEQLKNYQDYMTVEDLINVWSPREQFGGDNTDEEVTNYILDVTSNTSEGIQEDTKLRDLSDDQINELMMAMVKHESPSSYRRLNGRIIW